MGWWQGVNLTVVVFERWWVVVLGTAGFEFGCRGERRSREVTTVTNSDRSFIFPPVISISHLSISSLIFHLSVVFQKKNGEDQRKSWDEKRKRPVSSSSSCNLSSLSVSSLCCFFFLLNSDMSCLRRQKERTKHNLHLWNKKIKDRDCNPCVFFSTNRFSFSFYV